MAEMEILNSVISTIDSNTKKPEQFLRRVVLFLFFPILTCINRK